MLGIYLKFHRPESVFEHPSIIYWKTTIQSIFLSKVSGLKLDLPKPAFDHPSKIYRLTFVSDNHPQQKGSKNIFRGPSLFL